MSLSLMEVSFKQFSMSFLWEIFVDMATKLLESQNILLVDSHYVISVTSQKHTYIILTSLNPTFI